RALDISPGKPILIDKFLESAIEVDVDALSDGTRTLIGGVMQHIEEAGVHSGDSACVLPPHSLPAHVVEEIRRQTRALAQELQVAFAKSQMAASSAPPLSGTVFISVNDRDKADAVKVARGLAELGYNLISTRGTARVLREAGVSVQEVPKLQEGGRPNLIDK